MKQPTITMTLYPNDIELVAERDRMLSHEGSARFCEKRLEEITTMLACSYICAIKNQSQQQVEAQQ